MNPLDIIIDTDIGDDIDDALAIALALRSPELNLVGVTTVYLAAPARAQLAEYLLRVYGRAEVPVVPGCSKALLQPSTGKPGWQMRVVIDEFLKWRVDVPPPAEHAAVYLANSAREMGSAQSPLTIVPIGALTNIALALTIDPHFARNARIVMMGGCWDGSEIEWNIRCDPEAAAIVFASGIEISMVGLDVTRRCTLNDKQVASLGEGPSEQNRLLGSLINCWRIDNHNLLTLHDPLAVLSLFDECITWAPKRLEIELCGPDRGRMRTTEGETNARVAVDVDVERVVEQVMSRLTNVASD